MGNFKFVRLTIAFAYSVFNSELVVDFEAVGGFNGTDALSSFFKVLSSY